MTKAKPEDFPSRIIVMGVSGSGKSSVGKLLAEKLGFEFRDADDLHPEANRKKMASGIGLTDDDRWPWLEAVGETLASAAPVVIACSALKKIYRDKLRSEAPGTYFIHLTGTRELLSERMSGRSNHFMPLSLLDSQLSTLEPLDPSEAGFQLDITPSANELVDSAMLRLEK